MLDRTVAQSLWFVSETIGITSKVVQETVSTGGVLAAMGIREVGSMAKSVLPGAGEGDQKLPTYVAMPVQVTAATAKVGATAVKKAMGSLVSFGAASGSAAAGAVRQSGLIAEGPIPADQAPSTETWRALMGLGSSGFAAFTGTLESIDEGTKAIHGASIDAAGDVFGHTFGKEAGELAKETIHATKDVLDAFKAVHTFDAHKFSKKVAKAAGTAVAKTILLDAKEGDRELLEDAAEAAIDSRPPAEAEQETQVAQLVPPLHEDARMDRSIAGSLDHRQWLRKEGPDGGRE